VDETASAEFNAAEIADGNGRDIEQPGSAEGIEHGGAGGTGGFPVVAGAFDRVGAIDVINVGGAVVTGIRVAVFEVAYEVTGLGFGFDAGDEGDEF
jgi:hypothetical protein